MNIYQTSLVAKTNLQFLLQFNTILVFILLLSGCQKSGEKKIDAKPAITIENLQTAYAKEMNRLKMYNAFTERAKKDKMKNIPIGTIFQTLKMALSMEEIEYGTMYANMLRCAEIEKQTEAIEVFRQTQDADSKHAELLRYAIDKGKDMPILKYAVCRGCGYILTTEKIDACPTCKVPIDNFEKI